ncbi:MAG TPA: helix-turn-helix domain-containing protein [Tepidiformaceae bacterium]|nr:helix-turn-helix domain-containing protein [Tepidiformaceae bacterium]
MTTVPRILAAAMELFGTQGFEATSIRQIAERCELTDAAVLYHFGSKRRILAAIWNEVFEDGPESDVDPAASVAEQVDRIVALALTDTAMRDAEARLMVRQTLAGDCDAIDLRARRLAAWKGSLEGLFLRAYPADQAALRADALTMLLTGCVLRAQIELGHEFAQRCRDLEYQQQVQGLARTLVPAPYREAV